MAIEAGAILEGTIINITTFGAFVDIEGKTGLVHISEVADSYVKDIKDFLKEGEKMKVKVLKIEPNGKISLSIKQANPDLKPKEGTPSSEAAAQRPSFGAASGRPRTFDSRPPAEKKPYNRSGDDDWARDRRPRAMEKGPQSFEDMMSRFQKDSEEKLSEFKRRQEPGGNVKRKKS
ncbi:Polyribonucleotide nucleotidyltransferase [anaerobic digester metagenome]